MLVVSVIYCLIAGTLAVTIERGPCPKVNAIDVDLNRLVGTWHEYAGTIDKYHGAQKCPHGFFRLLKEGLIVVNSTSIVKRTGTYVEVETDLTKNTTDNSINILSHVPLVGETIDHYWNIDQVDEKYAISWSCKNVGSNHESSMFIYTRETNPSFDVIQIARRAAARNGLPKPNFTIFDQHGC